MVTFKPDTLVLFGPPVRLQSSARVTARNDGEGGKNTGINENKASNLIPTLIYPFKTL